MNIAQQIKAYHHESLNESRFDSLVAECEEKAVTIDQDWDAESTTYTFADGSCIVWSGSNVSAYGCAQ